MGLRLAADVLTRAFERIQREIDAGFGTLLPIPDDARARLIEAMRYAAIGGGKRVRPLLLVATGAALIPMCIVSVVLFPLALLAAFMIGA